MRLTELLTEESMRDFMYDEVTSKLERSGYRELGSGADAVIYTKDDGSVIKIILPEDDGNDRAVNTFKDFIDFCIANKQYANIPRVQEIKEPKIKKYLGDADLYGVVMEKLNPIRNHSFEEAMVWILSDLCTEKVSWQDAVNRIKEERTWEHYSEMNPTEILIRLDQMDERDLLEYEVLFKLMMLLYHKGRINKLGWDLHTENVMQRDDGTLVIIDPWFNAEAIS